MPMWQYAHTFRIALAVLLLPSAIPGGTATATNRDNKTARVVRCRVASPFKTWLEQDVVWIITPQERAAFNLLKDDEQREKFVEAFWSRRDPTPDTYGNEFKEEHYRRIAYANDHFSTQIPGWKTDRGRVYITYGPPDKIDTYPFGRPQAPDANQNDQKDPSTFVLPLESWSYRYLEGVGMDVDIDFVDVCNCGDYRMKMLPELKDAILNVPRVDTALGDRRFEPGGLRFFVLPSIIPQTKFKKLEEKLNSKEKWKGLPFEVRAKSAKVTDLTSVVPITITFQSRDLAFIQTNDSQPATIHIIGHIVTVTGHVSEVFEEFLEIDLSSQFQTTLEKTLALRNGLYRLEVAAEDAGNEHWGVWRGEIQVGRP